MRPEDVNERIRRFDELVEAAARAHRWTWCRKIRDPRLTSELRGDECVACRHFVLNEGACDPL